jgi:DNA-binding transcriptional ArsR family regulator
MVAHDPAGGQVVDAVEGHAPGFGRVGSQVTTGIPASIARSMVWVRKSPLRQEMARPSTRWVMKDSRISFCRSWSAFGHRGAEQRLGRLMLRLGRFGARDRKDTATLSVSYNDLAQMAGMSRSHVTVTMGRLRRLGLVRYQREGPLRVDVPALTVYLASGEGLARCASMASTSWSSRTMPTGASSCRLSSSARARGRPRWRP